MKPALNTSCPKCHASLRVLRTTSTAVVCASCRHASRIQGAALAAEGELPLPPLSSHRFNLGMPMRVGGGDYVIAAIDQVSDAQGGQYTEYTLYADDNRTLYLEESAEEGEWARYVPLADSEKPVLQGEDFALGGSTYKRSERYALKRLTACGEFDDLPKADEKYAAELYEGSGGMLCREVDSVSWNVGERSRFFRVEEIDEREVRLARLQASLGGSPQATLAGPRAETPEPKKKSLGFWGKLAMIGAVAGYAAIDLVSCDSAMNCEQQARASGWGTQQVQECRNSQSRSSGSSGGK
jgi:hypothetical protein